MIKKEQETDMENGCEHEIIDFVKFWFGFKPHKYQKEFLVGCTHNKRLAGLWARQSGKSTCIALYVLYMCLTSDEFKILIVAPTQRQSSELYKKVRSYAEGNEFIFPFIKSSSQTEVVFMNGSRIVALPCGPEGVTIKGFTGDVVIEEEAGYLKDSVDSEVITPMIASKQSFGQKIKIGTPKGKNHFYHSCFGKDTNFVLYHYDWKRIVDDGQYNMEFIEEQKRNLTDLEFSTEYEARFIEDSDCYFKQSLIDSCIADYERSKFRETSLYVLGVDFARMGEDCTVYVVLERDKSGKLFVSFVDETKQKKLTDGVGRVKMLHNTYRFEKIYLDETGLGSGPTDFLSEELGSYTVEGVTFTVNSKMDLYSNLKKLMEQGKLKLPNNRKLLYQLADLRYEITASGNLKLHHPERGHDDYPDALALACYYFKDSEEEEYEPIFM